MRQCISYMVSSAFRLLPAIVFSFALVCLAPLSAYAATVASISVKGLHSIGRDELLDMLGFKEGGRIDPEGISFGIKRAFLKGLFDDISVETDDLDPANVVITVRERDTIKKISFEGEYRLSVKALKENLIFRDGDVMRYDRVDEAVRTLRDMYALAGYPDAVVSISVQKAAGPGAVAVVVQINAGNPLLVKEIRISKNDRISEGDLGLSAGDVYDQHRLKNELHRIREYLKKDGYFRPAVGPYGFRDGELYVVVDPGKRLQVFIDGNSAISEKRLQKEIPFFEIESFNDEIVDEAASRMISVYRKEGYPSAQIAPVVTANDKEISVRFFVFEGKRISIRSIVFSGTTYPDESLKNIMQLKEGNYYDSNLKEQDRDALREFYNALGYLDASAGEMTAAIDDESGSADLSVTVEEGLRTVIASIDIAGADADVRARLLGEILLRTGDPYNEVDISDARFLILDYYVNKGYANIDVSVQRSIQTNKAHIIFNIIEGRKKFFGRTIISGNRHTKYEAIRRELLHDEGEPYSFRTIAGVRQRLYKLGLFTDVEIEPFDAGEDRKDLLVRVKEGNAGAFEFGFGYADYERFRGYAEVSYRNLFGMNRQGLMRVELSSLEDRIILQYYEPWFLSRPLPFRALFLHENKTEITIPGKQVRYKLERYSFSAGVEKKLSEALKAELYYEFSLVNTSDIQPDVILSKEDVGTLSISAVRPSLVYDTRDNPFEPTTGIVAGITAKLASPVLFSESNFAKLTLYGSLFRRLHKRIILALSARGGIAYTFGSTVELPIVERFFLGGRSSVRGYEQDMLGPKGTDGDPTGGNTFVMGSIELRTYVGKSISIVPFFDLGNVWVSAGDSRPSDMKFTTGLGFRYATPVGPLRVDYGYKLNRDRSESGSEIHFSIGHAF